MLSNRFLTACLLVATLACSRILGADDASESRRAKFLEQMRELAKQTKVMLADSAKPAELVENPIFRYDDQPRRFIDATLWVWTDGVRPVAFEKVEARNHQETLVPQWGYCFTSAAPSPLAVQWNSGRKYQATDAGSRFREVPKAPAVADREVERKRQLRELARGFSARIVIDPRTNSSEEMRLLATPIFEYADPETKAPLGAVFAFSTNGTNPDLVVIFEARPSDGRLQWQFATARMTTGGLLVKHKGEQVWEAPFVSPHEGPFATWMFFATPRTPVEGEDQP